MPYKTPSQNQVIQSRTNPADGNDTQPNTLHPAQKSNRQNKHILYAENRAEIFFIDGNSPGQEWWIHEYYTNLRMVAESYIFRESWNSD